MVPAGVIAVAGRQNPLQTVLHSLQINITRDREGRRVMVLKDEFSSF
jgi:hypothetical protein